MRHATLSLCLIGAALLAPLPAAAQSAGQAPGTQAGAQAGAGASPAQRQRMPTGWQVQAGAGVIVNPEFQGADSYQVLPIPFVDVSYRDAKGTKLFFNVPQGLGGYFVRHRDQDSGFQFNLGAGVAPGFINRGENDIPGLDSLNIAIEGRLYAEANWRNFSLTLTSAQALGTGHEGFWSELGASYQTRVGMRGFFRVGPTLRFVDNVYADSFYSISLRESEASGLDSFEAGSGIESIGLQSVLSVPIKGRWRWTAVAGANQLLGDFADSPVVQDETQLFFLSAVTYSF